MYLNHCFPNGCCYFSSTIIGKAMVMNLFHGYCCFNNLGTIITAPIPIVTIPTLHPKIFQSKPEFNKWILAAKVQMKKQKSETRQMTVM